MRLRELSIMYGGDISFLGDFLGTSGASGKHPCPHCIVNSDTIPAGTAHSLEIVGHLPLPVTSDPALHFDPELFETGRTSRRASRPAALPHDDRRRAFVPAPPRSQAQSAADLKTFETRLKQKIARAQECHNQIATPIPGTEFEGRIVPSVLHILLGLTKRVRDLLLDTAKKLDDRVRAVHGRCVQCPTCTDALCPLYDDEERLRGERERLSAQVAQLNSQCQAARTDINKERAARCLSQSAIVSGCGGLMLAEKELKQITRELKAAQLREEGVRNALNETPGPFRRAIAVLEDQLNIKERSYHGGALVGNDCAAFLDAGRLLALTLRPREVHRVNSDGTRATFRVGDEDAPVRFACLFEKLRLCMALAQRPEVRSRCPASCHLPFTDWCCCMLCAVM
jgi:hypothetical protein